MNSNKNMGDTSRITDYIKSNNYSEFPFGRVISQHKDGYIVSIVEGQFKAVITGNLRFNAGSENELPAVGDWVLLTTISDPLVIWKVLPRQSKLARKSVHQHGEAQLIGANIDVAFIVQAAGSDFNLNRMERYIAICHEGGVTPALLLNKSDLLTEDQLLDIKSKVNQRFGDIQLLFTSIFTPEGMDDLHQLLKGGLTYCLLGSSGVGKSSITNYLLDEERFATNAISEFNNKGMHTTTSRALVNLPNGALLMDTPGMRELGITNQSESLGKTFSSIEELADKCRFKDCSHVDEPGCAVLQAVVDNDIEQDMVNHYHKLQREANRFEISKSERRAKDKKQGKVYKQIIQEKKNRKKGW